jgi:hypothetical protein
MTLALLCAVIFMANPCAESVSSFVTGFGPGSAKPTEPAYDYVPISTDMSEEEIKAAIDEARRQHSERQRFSDGAAAPLAPAPPIK